jgi:hypothetical protein
MHTFLPDQQLARLAEAYSLDVQELVALQFQKQLDFSDESVGELEQVLETFHQSKATAQPTDEQLAQFAKAFGSYLGEVVRRQHGAEWGQVTLEGQTFPGMRLGDGSLVWPWGRVQKRLTDGAEESVTAWLASLMRN